jgi:hypothetical protein
MQRIGTSTAVAALFGAGKPGFQDGNPATATPATFFNAAWCNSVQEELAELIEACGLTLNPAVFTQLAQAIRTGKLYISAAAGTSDAITASFSLPVSTLAFGITPLLVKATAANLTTTPTFTPNAGVIAATTIVKGANQPLALGDIAAAGYWMQLLFDAVSGNWVLLNPATGLSSGVIGEIRSFALSTPPPNWMSCTTSPSYQSTTGPYAAVFAAIGYAFGGTGASFSLPWIPLGGVIRNGGTVGASDVGQVINHVHTPPSGYTFAGSGGGSWNGSAGSYGNYNIGNTGNPTTGGGSNIAAGTNFLNCFRYQ